MADHFNGLKITVDDFVVHNCGLEETKLIQAFSFLAFAAEEEDAFQLGLVDLCHAGNLALAVDVVARFFQGGVHCAASTLREERDSLFEGDLGPFKIFEIQ